MATGSVFHKL